jgi:hypothetical protein
MNKTMKACIKFAVLVGKEIIIGTVRTETAKETTEEQ